MDALIRRATADETEPLAALKAETFREVFLEEFAIPYPADDLARFQADSYSAATVARELADPARATWVAEMDGALVGYAQVGPCKLPHPDVRPGDGELYQLYVLRRAYGLRIGRRLLDAALAHLADAHPGPVWLGVWSGNARAQAVYAGYGFTEVGTYRFPVGDWYDDELIFRRD